MQEELQYSPAIEEKEKKKEKKMSTQATSNPSRP